MIHLVTDTHFGHFNVIKYCNRPEDHEARMFKAMSEIPHDDILIHLGDVCFGNPKVQHEKWIRTLPVTRKILLVGNHDQESDEFYLSHGWSFVLRWPLPLKVGNKTVLLSHFPATDEEMEFYKADLGIFGHEHNKGVRGFCDNRLLLAMEFTGYRPVPLDIFVEKGYAYFDKPL